MRRLLLLLALLAASPAAAQDEAEPPVQSWYCEKNTETPLGSVGVYRYVSLTGEQLGGGTSWLMETPPGAISVYGGWSAEFDTGSGEIAMLLQYEGLPPGRLYRFEIRRDGLNPPGAHLAQGPLTEPEEGKIQFFTDVAIMAATDSGASRIALLVLDADGNTVRRDSFNSAAFRRQLALFHTLQAPVNAMTRNYRRACELVDGDGTLPMSIPTP